ncbi:MAG: hypothetical protein ABIR70_19650 [Bryobacteraceae bacterium]
MNLAHLHLLLNHFPTVGMIIGLGLFLAALLWNSDHLKRASLGVFLAIGLIAMPTYMTGNAAQEILAQHPSSAALHLTALIEAHQSWALLAFILISLNGLLAWTGLWQYRRHSRPAAWILPAVLVCSAASFGTMGIAANLGGDIMHPEVRDVADGRASWMISAFSQSVIKAAVTDSTKIWAACEAIHFMGLAILFGMVLLIDLRILGFLKGVSFESIHKLLPYAVAAYAVNLATGMTFFIAASDQYTGNPVFYWKVGLLLLASANLAYFTVMDDSWLLKAGENAPGRTKFAAVTALVLWIGVMYAGRMLPFIGNAF